MIKLEQRSWIKIEVARYLSTQECFQRLREQVGDKEYKTQHIVHYCQHFIF